ncbi:hypothetical protein [Flavobacterium sp. 102]|uniref:hypothetical protein n=1 Tax=Flavobacterium sp. 102 TaxID=2135623 RepID=UPI000EADDD8B|nr:hypothetical protein [Flavobacterium sp. 102]RKS03099.1 hypothetical protein C8C84_2840 [Flavobacterium sp. 102]
MAKPEPKRICIYPKDVQRITGRGYRYSRLLLLEIRKHFNKQPQHLVAVEEFCQYTGLQVDHVMPLIVG